MKRSDIRGLTVKVGQYHEYPSNTRHGQRKRIDRHNQYVIGRNRRRRRGGIMSREYWKKRIKYYTRKFGKNSIEVKSAKLNLQAVIAEGGE